MSEQRLGEILSDYRWTKHGLNYHNSPIFWTDQNILEKHFLDKVDDCVVELLLCRVGE